MKMRLLILIFLVCTCAEDFESVDENICPTEERYTVNVTQLVVVPYQVRSYKWCLNYPPRCSFYTTEEREVEETVPEEKTRIVNECCPGFQKDSSTEKCISHCEDCVNGDCVASKCDCHSGYWSNNCNLTCQAGKWGKNCDYDCVCENGDCNAITGYCICLPGWEGNRCEEKIIESIPSTTISSSTTTPEYIEPSTSPEEPVTTTTVTSTHYTTTQTLNESTTEKYLNETPVTWLFNSSHDTENYTATRRSTEVELKPVPVVYDYNESEHGEEFLTSSTTDDLFSVAQSTNSHLKAKVINFESTSIAYEEKWFNSSDLHPNVHLHVKEDQQHQVENSHLVFSIVAVAGIIATVIFIIILTTSKFRIKQPDTVVVVAEKSGLELEDKGLSTVTFYSHNIFNTAGQNGVTPQDKDFCVPCDYENTSGDIRGTLEAHVICNLTLPKISNNYQGTFYDHPPSTGSYRAASIPEPPEEGAQQLLSIESKEHLYDEIPCWNQPLSISENNSFKTIDTLSLYQNSPKP